MGASLGWGGSIHSSENHGRPPPRHTHTQRSGALLEVVLLERATSHFRPKTRASGFDPKPRVATKRSLTPHLILLDRRLARPANRIESNLPPTIEPAHHHTMTACHSVGRSSSLPSANRAKQEGVSVAFAAASERRHYTSDDDERWVARQTGCATRAGADNPIE